MANFNNLTLTASGVKALLAAQAGTALTLSKIGLGSGSTTGSTVGLTDLIIPEMMMPISEKKTDSNSGHMTLIARMTNEGMEEGFYWRETGLFFEDAEGNDVLFAYACITDNTYDYIPAYNDQRYVKYVRIANIVSDSANITIKESDGLLYVDTLTFEEYKNEVKDSINSHTNNKNNPHSVTKAQVGLEKVPNVATNDQTPTYTNATNLAELISGEKITIAFGKIAKAIIDLISHIGNKNNPHSITTSQIGVPNLFVNNCAATESGFALDARQGKALQDQISEQNSKLEYKDIDDLVKLTEYASWVRAYVESGYVCIRIKVVGGASGSIDLANITDPKYWPRDTAYGTSVIVSTAVDSANNFKYVGASSGGVIDAWINPALSSDEYIYIQYPVMRRS